MLAGLIIPLLIGFSLPPLARADYLLPNPKASGRHEVKQRELNDFCRRAYPDDPKASAKLSPRGPDPRAPRDWSCGQPDRRLDLRQFCSEKGYANAVFENPRDPYSWYCYGYKDAEERGVLKLGKPELTTMCEQQNRDVERVSLGFYRDRKGKRTVFGWGCTDGRQRLPLDIWAGCRALGMKEAKFGALEDPYSWYCDGFGLFPERGPPNPRRQDLTRICHEQYPENPGIRAELVPDAAGKVTANSWACMLNGKALTLRIDHACWNHGYSAVQVGNPEDPNSWRCENLRMEKRREILRDAARLAYLYFKTFASRVAEGAFQPEAVRRLFGEDPEDLLDTAATALSILDGAEGGVSLVMTGPCEPQVMAYVMRYAKREKVGRRKRRRLVWQSARWIGVCPLVFEQYFTPDQLAQVLVHEMAHRAGEHSEKSATIVEGSVLAAATYGPMVVNTAYLDAYGVRGPFETLFHEMARAGGGHRQDLATQLRSLQWEPRISN
jgi:hypothetical protein